MKARSLFQAHPVFDLHLDVDVRPGCRHGDDTIVAQVDFFLREGEQRRADQVLGLEDLFRGKTGPQRYLELTGSGYRCAVVLLDLRDVFAIGEDVETAVAERHGDVVGVVTNDVRGDGDVGGGEFQHFEVADVFVVGNVAVEQEIESDAEGCCEANAEQGDFEVLFKFDFHGLGVVAKLGKYLV